MPQVGDLPRLPLLQSPSAGVRKQAGDACLTIGRARKQTGHTCSQPIFHGKDQDQERQVSLKKFFVHGDGSFWNYVAL